MRKLPEVNKIGVNATPMKTIFQWVVDGKTLKKCADDAGCTLYQLNARIKKYPAYGRRLEEARRLAAESHLQAAMDALDMDDKEISAYDKAAAPVVAMRKARSDLHMKLAKVADRERLSDMVKPTAPTPTMIIAINGIDMISRNSVEQEIRYAQMQVIEQAPAEALTLRGETKQEAKP